MVSLICILYIILLYNILYIHTTNYMSCMRHLSYNCLQTVVKFGAARSQFLHSVFYNISDKII